jgi:hypothetical protein
MPSRKSHKEAKEPTVLPTQEARVFYEVKLDPKLANDGQAQSEAYRAGSQMTKVLAAQYFKPSEGDVTLKVAVLSISKGSRWGRICCGECGVGWASLTTEWCLTRDGKDLSTPIKHTTLDSGAAGTKDGDKNFAKKELVDSLAKRAAHEIGKKAMAEASNNK